jgi:osmotically-inducible protein OsmY
MKRNAVCVTILLTLAVLPLATFSSGCASRHYDTTEAYMGDKALASRVKTQLARDPIAKATEINVTTFSREVQLSGFVGTQDEKTRAAQIAASVPGVVTVHDNLIVRTGR